MIDYKDALAVGWIIIPLHRMTMTATGVKCLCERPDCEAAGKHPKASNWQAAQPFSEQQLAYLEDEDGIFGGNQLLDSHGVVLKQSGLLVVDVDGRNGGFESAKALAHIREACGYIVETGSGSGEHWYFKAADADLRTKLDGYPGIDFKSSGFVVGCGSLHKSGHRYEASKGSPADVTEAPAELLALLARPHAPDIRVEGTSVTMTELTEMMRYVRHDAAQSYDRWLAVGMALHHATSGSADGAALWESWTQAQGRDDTDGVSQKWHSFGKSSRPVTQGTLMQWAREGGYTPSVTFDDDTEWEALPVPSKASPDLLKPHGLVGELTDWINSRCMYPREHLAVAAALQIVGNIAGLHHAVDKYDTCLNLFTICVAGSRTGKGAIKSAIDDIHHAVGLSPATHGKFKSSQELVRNAIYHQAVHYVYDEFGKQLEKLAGASKGGAHYLEDLMAELIAIYSVPRGQHGISGDMKRELEEMLDKRVSSEAKKAGLEQGENLLDYIKKNPGCALERAVTMRKSAANGIVQPFLTFFALSEPRSYNAALEKDPWLATGGFLGRSLFFEEMDNVPSPKPIDEVYRGMPSDSVMLRLHALANAGTCDKEERIERRGEWVKIKWSEEALNFNEQIKMYWREIALSEDEQGSGMESQALGAHELTIKVAGILGVANGIISEQDIKWAHELVKKITLDKISRTKSGEKLSGSRDERGEGLLEALMRYVSSMTTSYCTVGKARQAVGKFKASTEAVSQGLELLVSHGRIAKEVVKGGGGKIAIRYMAKK